VTEVKQKSLLNGKLMMTMDGRVSKIGIKFVHKRKAITFMNHKTEAKYSHRRQPQLQQCNQQAT